MDLELSADDVQLQDVIGRILSEHAGVFRARECREAGGREDDALLAILDEDLGWRDLLAGTTPDALVQQCIVAEACGRHVAQIHVAALATGAKAEGGAVGVLATPTHAVRWPRSLSSVVVESEAHARSVVEAEVFQVGWGDPWGRVVIGDSMAGRVAEETGRWYRLILLAEVVGAALGALDRTVTYLTERPQFGSPLASRQALRHRLAELSAEVTAAQLATFEAAASGAPGHAVDVAALLVVSAAERLVPELQRFTGAIGLTDEYGLHLLTGRVRSIAAELGAPARLATSVHRALRESRT